MFPFKKPFSRPPIKSLFEGISEKYDLMNTVMSVGIHRYWKKVFIDLIPQAPNLQILDLASGTGDIAFGYLKKVSPLNPSLTLFDLSPAMLQRSKDHAINKNIKGDLRWQEGKAESLPFPDNTFDVCTVSFGLRNFDDQDQALAEIYRVLKPGGVFLCMEFSQPDPSIASFYEAYLSTAIPTMGKILAGNKEAYQYLGDSIQNFMGVEELKNMLEKKGFKFVSYTTLTKKIIAIHRGWK